MYKVGRSRTPQGVRGLKPEAVVTVVDDSASHSARSAWIETIDQTMCRRIIEGRTPQGVRGLKLTSPGRTSFRRLSHSARSAWIETTQPWKATPKA